MLSASGALLLTSSVTAVMSEQQLRFGVIGTGCIGLEHLRNLHLVPGARVTAIADPHEPSRQQAVECLTGLGDMDGVSVLDDYHELLALPSVDAILVCTPNDHHIEAMPAIVESGKHCLVEKPLCTDVAACATVEALVQRACDAARAAGRAPPLYWVGMEYRYIPSIARLVGEASGGVVGDLRMLSIREHRFPFLRKVDNWNRFSARTGGTLVEKCCHFFDLMRLILRSEPTRVMATGGQDANFLRETYDGAPADVLDNAYVLVEFASGARACLELCMFAEASRHQEEISLVGTRGKLEVGSTPRPPRACPSHTRPPHVGPPHARRPHTLGRHRRRRSPSPRARRRSRRRTA